MRKVILKRVKIFHETFNLFKLTMQLYYIFADF